MMQIKVTSNLADLRKRFEEFSDRRFNAALATSLTRTASQVRNEIKAEMPRVLEDPTPWTLGSIFSKGATAQSLTAEVNFKDDRAATNGGTPATYYLLPQVEGGSRRLKRLEVALQAVGALPPGHYAVPAAGAALDDYGNVTRAQIVQMLSQLRTQPASGSPSEKGAAARKQIAAQRKAGGRFFVVRPGESKATPGVYQREFTGRTVTPVFLFFRRVTYRPRFDFYGLAQRLSREALPDQVERAFNEALQRLRKRT